MIPEQKIVIFEGYDGAGKTTLIRESAKVLEKFRPMVIGRKEEDALKPISRIIESPVLELDKVSEILLRIALEIERYRLVRDAITEGGMVFLDRGFLSMEAWVDYYGLNRSVFLSAFNLVRNLYSGALVIVCEAEFEICWERIESEGEMSKKEQLGRTRNAIFFEQYFANIDLAEESDNRFEFHRIRTTGALQRSLDAVLNILELPK